MKAKAEGRALRVSTDLGAEGHYITRKGEAIFLLGDTVWPLAVRFDDEQINAYLDDTHSRGFNVVGLFSTTVWAAYDEYGKNRFGDSPYRNSNPWQLNVGYWDRYAYVISQARARGMYVYFCVGHPLRHNAQFNALDTARKAYDYGRALGEFFREHNRSIIWSPGTDQNPELINLDRVDDLVEGIADGVNGASHRDGDADFSTTSMSYHVSGGHSTVDFFHDKPWLDFNGFQTWRDYDQTVELATRQYRKRPVKPGIEHEPAYEGDLSHKDGELKTGWHSRFQAYWSLFSGSCGHINGTTGIWDLGTRHWGTYGAGLEAEGRNDMQWVRKLIESVPLDSRVPEQSLIASDANDPDKDKDYICAARGADRDYAFVYSTRGDPFTLDMTMLGGEEARARWYDPRTGEYREIAVFATRDRRELDPPGEPEPGNDWVLVLDVS